jgi:hypothetical protein
MPSPGIAAILKVLVMGCTRVQGGAGHAIRALAEIIRQSINSWCTNVNNLPNLDDLNIFLQVARRASFAAVADERGMSAAFVSKRIRLLEESLGCACCTAPPGG